MRLVRRERAVLAVAAAGPRQRQREVPTERDPAAHARGPFYGAPILAPLMRAVMCRRRPWLPASWPAAARTPPRRAPCARATATLILDFTPNAVHAGVYAAIAQHYDRDLGLRLHVIAPTATTDSIKLLETGRVDFAILDIHDLAIAREHGQDIVGDHGDRPAPALGGDRRAGRQLTASPARQDGRDHRGAERHGRAALGGGRLAAAIRPRSRRSRSASTPSPTCWPAAWPPPRRSGTTKDRRSRANGPDFTSSGSTTTARRPTRSSC